jgi:hypothetical protein
MAGAFDNFDPTGAKQKGQAVAAPQAEAPAASSSGGAFSNFNPTGAKPVAAAPTPAPATPNAAAASPSGWGVKGWGPGLLPQPGFGDVIMPQSVQDFGNVAGNEASMYLLPGLRTEAQKARERLGPVAAAGADMAGNVLSPTTLLNALPGGSILAGSAHEGIKSKAQGNDWTTAADDAAMGSIAGGVGGVAAKAAPAVLPQLTRGVMDLGPAAAVTMAARKAFGEGYHEILTALGGYTLMHNLTEGSGEVVKKLAENPATQQAIKSGILGGSSAFRQGAGPWDQWIPGQ